MSRHGAIEGIWGALPVAQSEIVRRNRELQRRWYGEPLGDRARRLVVAFRISQAQLAEVLGISAPMLSQVMSARRAKIGNPAVLARLVMLERKVFVPGVASGESEAIEQALADVRDSQPTVGRDLPVRPEREPGEQERTAYPALREAAEPGDLEGAAELLAEQYPGLADVLRRAAVDRTAAS
jgi:transcriptional regulator with XRE-family HTH domain